jgi:hypothetical protein
MPHYIWNLVNDVTWLQTKLNISRTKHVWEQKSSKQVTIQFLEHFRLRTA